MAGRLSYGFKVYQTSVCRVRGDFY